MQGHVGHREIKVFLTLGRAADQRQYLHLPLFQPSLDLVPGSGAKSDVTAHGGQGGAQQFHGKTACAAFLIDNGKRRVIDLGGRGDGRGWFGCDCSQRRGQEDDQQHEREQHHATRAFSGRMNPEATQSAARKESPFVHGV